MHYCIVLPFQQFPNHVRHKKTEFRPDIYRSDCIQYFITRIRACKTRLGLTKCRWIDYGNKAHRNDPDKWKSEESKKMKRK
jgi:hypothetical protein